jgi:hypothetical protein
VLASRFQENLHKLVVLCKGHCGDKIIIILITPPPVHYDSWLKYQVDRYGDKATGKLERALDLLSRCAKALKLPCLIM